MPDGAIVCADCFCWEWKREFQHRRLKTESGKQQKCCNKRNFRANEFLVKTDKLTASQKMRVRNRCDTRQTRLSAELCSAPFSTHFRSVEEPLPNVHQMRSTTRELYARSYVVVRCLDLVWMCHTATGRTIQLYNKNVFIVYGHAVCQTSQQPELSQVDESKH